ncbi:hydroxyproline-rich glycoprotein family protein [Forsythia ovata]|uniref:Hydroxyproline-rich glycoprotein family protein n=1 Tax=Forsythia ovata TaxID=205694 RepID=A0ABD1X286_9LAMI
MSSVRNSVETVNAAATAIVSAESRVQPSTEQKRRWGSCWSLYWCFGSHKHSKRIGHAVLFPEPSAPVSVAPVAENLNHTATILLPFIAPPSSPTYFLQSDPPSATQSPSGLLSLTSLSINAYSPRWDCIDFYSWTLCSLRLN